MKFFWDHFVDYKILNLDQKTESKIFIPYLVISKISKVYRITQIDGIVKLLDEL